MKRSLWIAAVVTAAVLSACGGEGDASDVLEGTDVTVAMYDNRFEFDEIRIPVGGSVRWLGAGRNPHNAVDAEGAWSTEDSFGSLEQLEGDEAVVVYDESGEYIFFCTFHGNAEGDGMAGKLIVEDPSG